MLYYNISHGVRILGMLSQTDAAYIYRRNSPNRRSKHSVWLSWGLTVVFYYGYWSRYKLRYTMNKGVQEKYTLSMVHFNLHPEALYRMATDAWGLKNDLTWRASDHAKEGMAPTMASIVILIRCDYHPLPPESFSQELKTMSAPNDNYTIHKVSLKRTRQACGPCRYVQSQLAEGRTIIPASS